MKVKNPKATGFVLILSAFMCAADTMTLQPIIGLLAEEVFPQYSYSMVSLIMSASAIALFIISVATAKLSKTGKKRLLLIGSALFTIGGCAGILVENFFLLIATRIIEGAGAGLVLTVSMILIPTIFQSEEEVNKWMGLNGVVTSFFTAAVGFISGYLAMIHWKVPFAFYLVGIVILILQMMFIPDDSGMANQADGTLDSHISKAGVLMAVNVFTFAIITSFFFAFISGVIAENGIGGSAQAGIVTTMNTVGSFLVGFFFAKIFGFFKRFMAPVQFFFLALGIFLAINAQSLVMLCVAAFIHGAAYQQYFSYFLAKVPMISDETSLDANMSLCNGIFYGGQFCTPFLADAALNFFKTDSTVFALKFELGCLIVLMIVHFLIALTGGKREISGS